MSTRAIAFIIIFFSFIMFTIIHVLSDGIDQVKTDINRTDYDGLEEYE